MCPQETGNADLVSVCRVVALHASDALRAAGLAWRHVGSLTAYCKARVIVEAALAAQLSRAIAASAHSAGELCTPPHVVCLPVLGIVDVDGGVEDCLIHVECLALA